MVIKQYYWYCAHEFELDQEFVQCKSRSRRYFNTAEEATKAGSSHKHEEIIVSWKKE